MTAVRFTRHGDQYAVSFNYDPDIVSLIKTVPGYARSWDPTHKLWWVDADHTEQFAADLRSLGYTVLGLQQQRRHVDDANWARALFQRVGPHLRTQVYRALSKVLHSDIGGDGRIQQELNDARAELDDRKEDSA